jgi:DNA-binding transcriptional ArsR family regulator
MSIGLMSLAWKADMPTGMKMVLLALCDNANDQGDCYPSISNIAERCSMGERTVQSHIATMEDEGVVSRRFRSGRSTLYRIDPRKFRTPADSAPPQISHPTPADFAPRTIKEPSIEPSLNLVGRKKKRRTSLNESWCLSKNLGLWTLEHYPKWSEDDVRKIADKFRDYWIAVGAVRSDWDATWRNWCRNEEKSWTGLSAKVGKVSASEKRSNWMDGLRGVCNEQSGNQRIIDIN